MGNEVHLTWEPEISISDYKVLGTLKKLLQEDIESENLSNGTRLPSQRELAFFLSIHYSTVGKLYTWGINNGLLYTSVGSGTFVSYNNDYEKTITRNQLESRSIDLGLVSSFEEVNSEVKKKLIEILSSFSYNSMLTYSSPLGSSESISAAKQLLTPLKINFENSKVAIVSGAQNALAVILLGYFNKGDRIAVDKFTYTNFLELASLHQIELVSIDFDEEGMLPSSFLKEYKKKKFSGVFLMPSCNNPIGFEISEKRRKELAVIFRQTRVLIIEDDIHALFSKALNGQIMTPFQKLIPDQTIYISSMAKIISPGLRIAFIVYPNILSETIENAIFNINVKSSGIDSILVSNLITSSSIFKIIDEKVNLIRKANTIFDKYFAIPRPTNSEPLYRVIPIESSDSGSNVEKYFLTKGVKVFHSERFSINSSDESFIRVSLSSNNLTDLSIALYKLTQANKYFRKEIIKHNGDPIDIS